MPVAGPTVYSSRDRQLAPLLHSGFLLVGVIHTLLGPILPMLAAKWHLDDAEAGSLFIAQFTGAMIGSALSSLMVDWLGSLRLMGCGYAAMAAAVACLGVNSWGVGLLSVLSYGFAIGLIAPVTNLLVAEINSQRRAAALNILNFVWALGAVAGPALIALFARDGQLIRPLVGLAVLLSVIALLIARRSLADSSSVAIRPKPNWKGRARFERSAFRAWASPYALLTSALIFNYVGTEAAAAGWIASYAQRIGASASGFGTMMPSFFWAGLLIGRAAAPVVLRRVSETALVLMSLFMAGAGLVVILAGEQSDDGFLRRRSGWVGNGRRVSHHFCHLHPAVRESGVATDWIRLCVRRRGGSAHSLAGRIHFGQVWRSTHGTSHSTVLRGIYDCLANRHNSGVGSGAFGKSLISIAIVNRLLACETALRAGRTGFVNGFES